MPAFLHQNSRLTVTLWRDGKVVDQLPARTPEAAALIAIMMIEFAEELHIGDRLEVTEKPEVLPEASRASHMGG